MEKNKCAISYSELVKDLEIGYTERTAKTFIEVERLSCQALLINLSSTTGKIHLVNIVTMYSMPLKVFSHSLVMDSQNHLKTQHKEEPAPHFKMRKW